MHVTCPYSTASLLYADGVSPSPLWPKQNNDDYPDTLAFSLFKREKQWAFARYCPGKTTGLAIPSTVLAFYHALSIDKRNQPIINNKILGYFTKCFPLLFSTRTFRYNDRENVENINVQDLLMSIPSAFGPRLKPMKGILFNRPLSIPLICSLLKPK